MIAQTFLIVCVLILGSEGHEWGFGSCPTLAPYPNLSMEKFLGLWYVIEQFDTSSTCLTLNYTRESETSLKVTKNRQFSILDRAGLDHTNSYTGSLDIPFSNNQAFLRVKWPLNAAGKADYIIFDTDYETYAGVYDCQQITFFVYRESSAILSRKPILDQIFVDRVKRRLESYKIDVSAFNIIDHSSCKKNETDYRINVDEDTLGNFFSDTADTFKEVANKVADGVQGIASSVADTVKNIGTKEEIKEQDTLKLNNDLSEVEILN